ncbi:hypothetical protein [Psychrobacter sp. TB55-MNA-CIBAN-0194]|uniref:hypothetical protein n=1 Tax=Psychrobacter sp. TB55-MNA-CIBAN-0194 TaxID=3140445 RepID=UPI0033286ED8
MNINEMNKYIYRKATNEDFDELYSSPEAEKWLIPHYDNRRGATLAEPSVAKTWKVFRYMENYERGNEISDWFVYLDKDGSILIMQERFPMPPPYEIYSIDDNREQQFVVLYCSKALENDIQQICEQVVDLGRQGGYYLTGDPEPDFWEDPIISYKMAAPNDYGRYY